MKEFLRRLFFNDMIMETLRFVLFMIIVGTGIAVVQLIEKISH